MIAFFKLGRFLMKFRIQGFSKALNRMAVFVFFENRYLGSNLSIRPLRTDRFFRLFKAWSILFETSDIGIFEGAESNDDVEFCSKSIFLVESTDSIFANGSIFFDFLKHCRFSTKLRI